MDNGRVIPMWAWKWARKELAIRRINAKLKYWRETLEQAERYIAKLEEEAAHA